MSYDTIIARSPSIIYRPGGTPGGLVVTTWAAVQAFITLRQGTVILYVDDSITSPALVPGSSGVTDCEGRVEIRPYIIDAVDYSTLRIDDGATLHNLYAITDIEVRCNSQSATPSLSFSGTPSGGTLILQQFGWLSQAATATQPGVVVPVGTEMFVQLSGSAVLAMEGFNDFTVPLLAVPGGVPTPASLIVEGLDESIVFNNYASGAGNVNFVFDNSTAWEFTPGGTPPTLPSLTGTYTKEDASVFLGDVIGGALTSKVVAWENKPLDPATMSAPAISNVPQWDGAKWIAGSISSLSTRIDFTASTTDIFAPAATGIRRVQWQGCGGGGGGAGGGGGGVSAGNAGGEGGGGGGGTTLQTLETDIDLSHRIDVVIGGGGVPGTAGTPDTGSGAGAGGSGGDGGATYVFDFTTSTILAAFSGASGGAGGAGGTSGGPIALSSAGGCTFSGAQTVNPNNGFPAAGGPGGVGGDFATGGSPGNTGFLAVGTVLPGAGLFPGGTGGTTGGTIEGGGGGGGGAGPFGSGAVGGNGVDGPGTPGGDAIGNSGAGAGGGGGGESATAPGMTLPGGPGGTGGSGRLTGFYFV